MRAQAQAGWAALAASAVKMSCVEVLLCDHMQVVDHAVLVCA